MSNSLRKALDKDQALISPTSLYKIPIDNAMGQVMYNRLAKIVNEDMHHTAGGVPIRNVPYYASIRGGQYPVVRRGQMVPESQKQAEARMKREAKILKKEAQSREKERVKERHRGAISRSQVVDEILEMRDRQNDRKKVKRFLDNIDLHVDEVAQSAQNKINRARLQSEYNSPGGSMSSYYDESPVFVEQPLGNTAYDGMPGEIYRKLHEIVNKDENMRGGAWYDAITRAFKKAGEILTETPLKHIPGISTVGDIYKEIGKLGSGKQKRRGGKVQARKPQKKRGRGLSGRISNYPTIRT